jgi:NAD(P)-dependent dehydrogenase (short-subunit alcohol dehydrogenase family)
MVFGFFGVKSSLDILSEIPEDLGGQVCIVTGGTAGLGLASAQFLYERNAHVIITARNDERGKQALELISRQSEESKNKGKLEYGIMDQKSLLSVKAFAEWFLKKNLPLHVLLLNAGIAVVPFELVGDKIESHFFVNHLSHYYLTRLLLDKIKSSAPSRIVAVSSDAHRIVRGNDMDWEALSNQKYDGLQDSFYQYGVSKLANICFVKHLAEELKDAQVWVNASHPGKLC